MRYLHGCADVGVCLAGVSSPDGDKMGPGPFTQGTGVMADDARTPDFSSGKLFPQVYSELHSIAEKWFRAQPADHTLQPTALVNEVYLRFASKSADRWQDQAHFLATAATAMRQILISYARRRNALKRGGNWQRVTLDQVADSTSPIEIDLDALQTALTKLDGLNRRQGQVVELRFFGGMTLEQIAQALSVSLRTVKLDWQMSRAWLLRELEQKAP